MSQLIRYGRHALAGFLPTAGSTRAISYRGKGGALTIDFYVRADGTALDIDSANDPSLASGALSLATLESLKATTEGLVIGFSSQGGTFNTVPAVVHGGLACVGIVNGCTYINAPGEDVLFDIQDNIDSALVYCFGNQVAGVLTGIVRKNTSGSMRLAGSGVGGAAFRVASTAGAGGSGYGIKAIGLDIIRNHNTAETMAEDGYSVDGTAELEVIGGTIENIYSSVTPINAQAFTGHGDCKIKASGTVLRGVSMVTQSTGNAIVDLSNLDVTDWDQRISELGGDCQVTIKDSMFVNDGSFLPGLSGGLFGGQPNSVTAQCDIDNCNISITTGGLAVTLSNGQFNITDTTLIANGSSLSQITMASLAGQTGSLSWIGGSITRESVNIGHMFVNYRGALQLERLRISGIDTTGAGGIVQVREATLPSWVRACVVEWGSSGNNSFALCTNVTTQDFAIENTTFYSQGQPFDARIGNTNIRANNCTFVSNGIGVIDGSRDTDVQYDNCHYSGWNAIPVDANQVGATDSDPLFTNPGAGDFHIPGGSVLAGAGKATTVITDFYGKAYDNPPSVGGAEV